MGEQVTIKSASKLDSDSLKQITSFVKSKLGKDVKIKESLDKTLIAGFKLEMAGVEYDYSIKGSLDRLSKVL